MIYVRPWGRSDILSAKGNSVEIRAITKTKQNNTVTRADLANAVYREIGLSKSESFQLVNSIFEKIELSIISEGIVKLPGFGNFVTRLKTERTGRNPKTGKAVMISPCRVVTFKPSSKLIERVDGAHSKNKTYKRGEHGSG